MAFPGYRGTLPLDLKIYPVKKNHYTDEKGKKWDSNIRTGLEINPKDGRWYLFPTMMGGLDLPYKGAEQGAFKGKHFGVYSSYDEAMKADTEIHKYFQYLEKLDGNRKRM